jgi:hypothetical protein
MFDANNVPYLKKRSGPQSKITGKKPLNRFNFMLRKRRRILTDTYDVHDTGSGNNRKTILKVESAKKVPGKERDVDFFNSVRPYAAFPIGRQEWFKASLLKNLKNRFLSV